MFLVDLDGFDGSNSTIAATSSDEGRKMMSFLQPSLIDHQMTHVVDTFIAITYLLQLQSMD